MSTITPIQVREKHTDETRNIAIDFTDALDSGELLAGSPTIAVTGLTFSSVAINTSARIINGRSVPTGMAVQCRVVGGTVNTLYKAVVTAVTDATPPQTIVRKIPIRIINN